MGAVTAADVINVVPGCGLTLLYVEITSATAADTIDLTSVIAPYGSTIRHCSVFYAGGVAEDSAVNLSTDVVTIGTGPSTELVTLLVLVE